MEFLRSGKSAMSLDMAPLVDIIFQLLIFFMLSSTFLSPSMKLELPKAVSGDSQEQEKILVSIDKDARIYINSRQSSLDRLGMDLKGLLSGAPEKAIHFKGDKDMPYDLFVTIMDAARQAGTSQINIVHQAPSSGGDS